MVLSKFQSQMMRMMGEISRKQDVILRRLSTLENAHSTILSSVQRLQATQADQTPSIPTIAPDTDHALDSIPEPHRIEMETLRGINSRSFGAGNFAKRLTVRLFPELFGVDDLRLQYSFYGGVCNRKKPLELQRREVIRTYVCYFYPECRPMDTWNAMVVTKINEGLRRPTEKKSRPRKRPSAAVIDIPVPPQCDDPIETFVDNGLEYTRL
ncbi:hypothetical protein FSP39_012965 [Pinctada imbricata]|uniref:BEN domain-containing protein n=1 Tax=Pinctada imbricata TaxID=66713 RepID=A0AA88YQV4_PINIB|nr:hypothetical protein FSP39_012965 [Pinctada imbricata]